MSGYFKNIKEAFSTMSEGLKLTFGYLADARKSRTPIGVADEKYFDADKGIVTLEYPYESLPVPDNARYRLHNEIDDCIVCDKCAKVCPVDCIEIDPILAPETFGMTSDGTPKRIHAAKFDIDMSKCCFCGLCTTVCPTECLTMTKVYDFSEFDVNDHVYSFAEMSLAEIAQKRKELAEFEEKKAAAKAAAKGDSEREPVKAKAVMRPKPMAPKPAGAKPVMKPKPAANEEQSTKPAETEKPRPVMKKPAMKPVLKPKAAGGETDKPENKPKFKPRPMIPKKPKDDDGDK
ncbi:4Fe-4S binding protein [Marinoscillum sp. 108]|uniref:4Fe-4S binding protein n=1 Tax=Marinoscillum sp. 108 TaxID=2653151 RepID=UPI0012EF7008